MGALSQVGPPYGGSVVSNRHALMVNFYPSAGTPAGDWEGRRAFVRVPNDDLSCKVMTFPVPARLRGNPSPMHPADVPGSVLHAPQPWASDLYIGV
jgi:hypothetical protein